MRLTKAHIAILIVNLTHLSIFAFLFSARKNYEFLMYVGVVAFFVTVISFLHLKYDFTNAALLGLTTWGLLHMLGGFIKVNERALYAYQLIPGILRFDEFVHMFGFGFATLFAYYVLRPNLAAKTGWIAVSVLLVLIGMGLGALNEIIEFTAVLSYPETGVGGYENTMWDMVFNTIGAILAVIYINIKRKIDAQLYSRQGRAGGL